MAKDTSIAVRLDSKTKDALARAAEDDGRSLSSLVAKIIADWLMGQPKMSGVLPQEDPHERLSFEREVAEIRESLKELARRRALKFGTNGVDGAS